MRALGLDLALVATGLATAGPHGVTARTYRPRGTGHHRVADINVAVAATCRDAMPHLAVVEGLYVGHTNNTLELAGLHYLIRHWLWHMGIPYVLVAPQTRAVYATGNGRASKAEVLAETRSRYHHVVPYLPDDNAADALVLASLALDAYGQPLVTLQETHRRAIKSITWPALEVNREQLAAL